MKINESKNVSQILKGKSVLITRAAHQSKDLVKLVEKHGGIAIAMPLIELVELEDKSEIYSAFEQLEHIDWLVFTSENTVDYFFKYAAEKGVKFYFYPNLKIATVGEKTKLKLEQMGYRTNFVPIQYTAAVLAENMDEEISGKKILIPRSDIASNEYLTVFESRGAKVFPLTVYKNKAIEYSLEKVEEILNQSIDYLTFTSGSTVRSFHTCVQHKAMNFIDSKTYCIGPSTAKVASELGFIIDGIAEPHTVDALFELIIKDNKDV
ncbi:MAG: uroporphyrinogen-III synthase [Bacteroidetes bacterium]|nr:uroporphyrinogen-III synthase [Bacteroidota bacterium]